jgi:hypothetical protein
MQVFEHGGSLARVDDGDLVLLAIVVTYGPDIVVAESGQGCDFHSFRFYYLRPDFRLAVLNGKYGFYRLAEY